MNGNLPTWRKHFRRMSPAYLVLLLSLIPTLIAYRRVRENVAMRDQARFDHAVQATRDALFQRIDSVISALRGVRGLFDANPAVGLDQWQNYGRSLDLKGNYRGVLDIGFAQRVPGADKDRHIAAMRAGGFPDYALRADAEREEYFPMIYLSSATNSPNWAPGWDLLNEPKRGVAMERARQADRPMATEKVMLLTPEGPKAGPGLVIYLPVYRNGVKPAGDKAQKEATVGIVFASLVARDLGATLIRPQTNQLVEIEIFDGNTASRENLLYDSHGVLS